MIGRIYVTCDKENNVCIKYYDYDNIDKDGYNFVHIISFIRDDRELFHEKLDACYAELQGDSKQ